MGEAKNPGPAKPQGKKETLEGGAKARDTYRVKLVAEVISLMGGECNDPRALWIVECMLQQHTVEELRSEAFWTTAEVLARRPRYTELVGRYHDMGRSPDRETGDGEDRGGDSRRSSGRARTSIASDAGGSLWRRELQEGTEHGRPVRGGTPRGQAI